MSVTLRFFGVTEELFEAVARDGWRAHEASVWASPKLNVDPGLSFDMFAEPSKFAGIAEAEFSRVERDREEVTVGLVPAGLVAARSERLAAIHHPDLKSFDELKTTIAAWAADRRAMLIMTVP